jgi:HD-like signal output (HDOD) protein
MCPNSQNSNPAETSAYPLDNERQRQDPRQTTDEQVELESLLSFDLYRDLRSEKLDLPTLPEVAVRIGRAVKDDTRDAARIAEIIQTDPVITAKLIRVANSAYYGGMNPLNSCEGAIVRLGIDTTHNLVLTFALQDLFNSKSVELKKRMRQLWKHSTRVAALCFVLAKKTRCFAPDQVLLAGLIHDIGEIAILTYLDKYTTFTSLEEKQIDAVVAALRGQVGGMILRYWDFPPEFVTVAVDADEWRRDPGPDADYCDLVIIAQLHSFVGTPLLASVPPMNELPAFTKLPLGDLTPQNSLQMLDEAKEQVRTAESLVVA